MGVKRLSYGIIGVMFFGSCLVPSENIVSFQLQPKAIVEQGVAERAVEQLERFIIDQILLPWEKVGELNGEYQCPGSVKEYVGRHLEFARPVFHVPDLEI